MDARGSTSEPSTSFEDVWRDDRRHVLGLATRMLGDPSAAEDAVQEAFDRLLRVDLSEIDDVRGWLAVVVRRLCLNRFRSAYIRRESAVGTAPPEERGGLPGPARSTMLDPADRTTLDDQVREALMLVLDRLTPAERTAFVLHDVFGFPHASVAEIVGRTPTAVRQLASRARRTIRADGSSVTRPTKAPADHRMVAERFAAACAGGDLAALMAVLDPDVVGEAVLLGHGAILELHGRQRVATRILNLFGPGTDTVMVPMGVESDAGILGIAHGRIAAVVRLEERDGLIHTIHSYIKPPG